MIDGVGVVGLGLIGGSLARDLTAAGVSVFGWDHDPEVIQRARDEGVIRDRLSEEILQQLEVIVFAVPVRASLEYLAKLARLPHRLRLITDTGSTKREICAEAHRLGIGSCFVGGHPLAGDHRSGWAASRTGLFHNARVYLCATPESSVDAICCARDLWLLLKANPEVRTADVHDAMLAWTSHLAQLVSSAYGHALASAGYARDLLGPGGLSVARLAESNSTLWADIAVENADYLLPALTQIERSLLALRTALEKRDREQILEQLSVARNWAASESVPGRASVTVQV